ncbi:MAG: HEPN domain-containing protein [Tissierellales bacterium]|nr:HEPN domain-containing protein [Tissierellales bacterium]
MNEQQQLFEYRLDQAVTTLAEAENMLKSGFSARSIVNRAYYSMFYMILALLLKKNIQISTSKHTGVMSIFDKEFILTGLIDRKHSRNLHKTFDRRLEFDYKEMIVPSDEEVVASVDSAREFIQTIQEFLR